MTTIAQAIKAWEAKQGEDGPKAEDATEIKLFCQLPPIAKLDAKVLNTFKKCEHLSLSTNAIDRLVGLGGMSNLRVLSIGKNNLKKLEKLDEVAGTLEQLWISYNQITSLEGVACLTNLKTLYCSNNLIKSFSDLEPLTSLEKLKDVLFVGNPMYDEVADKSEARIHVLKQLTRCTKVDGEMVTSTDRAKAEEL